MDTTFAQPAVRASVPTVRQQMRDEAVHDQPDLFDIQRTDHRRPRRPHEGAFRTLLTMLAAWRQRQRDRRTLREMTDRMLADIGIDRSHHPRDSYDFPDFGKPLWWG